MTTKKPKYPTYIVFPGPPLCRWFVLKNETRAYSQGCLCADDFFCIWRSQIYFPNENKCDNCAVDCVFLLPVTTCSDDQVECLIHLGHHLLWWPGWMLDTLGSPLVVTVALYTNHNRNVTKEIINIQEKLILYTWMRLYCKSWEDSLDVGTNI